MTPAAGPERKTRLNDFVEFLRTHKLAWILPILLVAAVAVAIAWRLAHTPSNPFMYDSH